MNILGISAYYHDSAACLVRDGRIFAAAQEERFTRKKHDNAFPKHAIAYCLKAGGVSLETLDAVVFYEKPFLKFERILETQTAYAPLGLRSFLAAIPLWLKQKIWMSEIIKKEFNTIYIFVDKEQNKLAEKLESDPNVYKRIDTSDCNVFIIIG